MVEVASRTDIIAGGDLAANIASFRRHLRAENRDHREDLQEKLKAAAQRHPLWKPPQILVAALAPYGQQEAGPVSPRPPGDGQH